MANPKYPNLREFFCQASFCRNPTIVNTFMVREPFTAIEKALILYFSGLALEKMIEDSSTNLDLDRYLNPLHETLVQEYQVGLTKSTNLTADEKQELLAQAQGNIFYCASLPRLAAAISEPFASELESLAGENPRVIGMNLDLPARWELEETGKNIKLYNELGVVVHQLAVV
jgi:hypothetical protein